ncbi:hypothetical protein MUP35_00520 [Patescibacteria group bacterium]|nr:hypothetical protein [Patescibacteria group bacterium]
MTDINKEILKVSEKLLKKEIEKTGLPAIEFHKVCLIYGRRLTKAYRVNEDFVLACLNFMDVKVGEAFANNRIQDHIQMSLEASLTALKPLSLDKKLIKKISGCILNHHGAKRYPSIEAEICANADCFKFLHPRAFIAFIASLGKRGRPFEDLLKYAKEKVEEKIAIISLPEVKQEAKEYYQLLSKLFEKTQKVE